MTDFQKLWAGQTISIFGSLVSRMALMWCAVTLLRATPFQLALLALCDRLPGFFLGLVAGVWADRVRRRPLLLGTDLARALLIALIPLSALGGWLSFGLLLVVATLTGALSTLFDVAYQAYVPTVADEETLVRANSKLTFTASLAEIGAFGLAGWLVQWLSAPGALWIDATSFLVSALSLTLIRRPENLPRAAGYPAAGCRDRKKLATLQEGVEQARQVFEEASSGARVVLAQPMLRRLLLGEASLALSGGLTGTVYLLFMARELRFPAGELGLIFAIGGATSLLGAALAERIVRRFGQERATFGALTLAGLGMLSTALAPRAKLLGYAALTGNQVLTDPAWTLYEIQQTTLRQELSPPEALGRVNATFRVVALGMGLIGTVLAGAIAARFSARLVVLLGALAVILAGSYLYCTTPRTFNRNIYPEEQ